MDIKLRKRAKIDFQKEFFKLRNNTAFGKTMENLRQYRATKLVTTERRRNYLMLEPSYHTTKLFTENFYAKEMRKTKILMNKLVYLGLSVLDLSITVMYEFWYDYVKPKYGEKAKLCYMDAGRYIVHVKTDDNIYKDIAEDVETRFDISNYELYRKLPKGKIKK